MKTKVIIFRMGALDRFTVDPLAVLAHNGVDSSILVTELNDLAAAVLKKNNPVLDALFADDVDYIGCASRPRTVRALLDFGEVNFRSKKMTWLKVDYDVAALKSAHGTPWFPVIDRERCTGCGICFDYCLFSSYTRDDAHEPSQRVAVSNPLNCKTGCPACARLCNSGAVIFPFNPEPRINGALEDMAPREESDLLKAFEADPMKVLEERRKKRRLIDERKLAEAERERYS